MKVSKTYSHAIQGIFLSQFAPLGWYVIQVFLGHEFGGENGVYIYMSVGTAVTFCLFGAYVGSREELLSKLAVMDPLTSLYNRRYFDDRLRQEYAISERLHSPLCLIMIDIDYFKQINDKYGHVYGDKVLQAVARLLKQACRHGEVVSRVGGEEFNILLSHADEEKGQLVAQRFKNVIDQLNVETDKGSIRVSASMGVFSCTAGDKEILVEDIYKNVDKAMYRAKEQGRNRIVKYSEVINCTNSDGLLKRDRAEYSLD